MLSYTNYILNLKFTTSSSALNLHLDNLNIFFYSTWSIVILKSSCKTKKLFDAKRSKWVKILIIV